MKVSKEAAMVVKPSGGVGRQRRRWPGTLLARVIGHGTSRACHFLVEPEQTNTTPRRPRILLAASGSVAAIKFGNLCHCFSEWAEVKAVATKYALHFIDTDIPRM
ncbi:Phosphopantothenoylcysteine decarboxylase [Bienertia sinuspersici]